MRSLPSNGRAAALMLYRIRMNRGSILRSLNRMIADAAVRRRIFYDICTKEEKEADPSKKETCSLRDY